MSDDEWWLHLPSYEKQYVRLRLVEEIAKLGQSVSTITSPGKLAITHEPTLMVQRPHLELIDQALTDVLTNPGRKLMIWLPPRAGKSLKAARWFPFWWLTMRTHDRVILASYAASLAESHSSACRDLINAYGAEYGLRLRDDQATKSDWTLTTRGGLIARGVGGGLTGHGMDLGIIDDPYKDRAEADSPTIRAKVWDWYSAVFLSRMSPGARQVLVMTRWHNDDLCGRLIREQGRAEEGGEWHVLHMPAIAVPEDRERGFYPDPLGRAPGEPLTHPKLPEADTDALTAFWESRRAETIARDWNALYQGVPFDAAGALLTDGEIREGTVDVDEVPAPARVAIGVDPSGGGRDTAGLIVGQLGTDGKLYWLADHTARMPSDQWAEKACLLAAEFDADRIVVEKNFGGDMAQTLIRQAWDNLQQTGRIPGGLCPHIVEVVARRSKVLRAEPIAQAVKTGRAWFGPDPSLRNLKREWQMWEPGSSWSPGALDAAVHLATNLLPALPQGSRSASVTNISRDQVQAGGLAAVTIRRR